MIYISHFYDINDQQYDVTITTSSGSLVKSLELADEPFQISVRGDEANLYKPVRYQGGECKILTSEAPFDIFTGSAHGSKIVLQKDSEVLFTGYVTPNIYKQGWDYDLEEIELELIDGLSTLEYYKYEAAPRRIVTFSELISKLLYKCNCYTNFYFPTCYGSNFLGTIVISEQNFFEEKDSEDKPNDEDVAWTCKEVLEEVCRYLNVTAIAIGESVWFVDYDYIRNSEQMTWDKYDIDGSYIGTTTTANGITIEPGVYSESGTDLSITDVYNKVSVVDENYTFDSVFPDPFDFLENITADSDSGVQTSDISEGGYGEIVSNGNSLYSGNTNTEVLLDKVYSPEDHSYSDKINFIAVQYAKSPLCDLYCYNSDFSSKTYPNKLCYSDLQNFYGAVLAKMECDELERYAPIGNSELLKYFKDAIAAGNFSAELDYLLASNGKSKIDYSNYIIMTDQSITSAVSDDTLKNTPFVKYATQDMAGLFGGSNAGLVIQGKYLFHAFELDPYPIPGSQVDIKQGRYTCAYSDVYLICKLKWGNKFWNGEEWQNRTCTFKLKIFKSPPFYLRCDEIMFQENKIPNTVPWRAGIDVEGYYIPIPDEILVGTPEFTIYRIHSPNYDGAERNAHRVVFLKDFKIVAAIGDPTFSDINDTDTVYTNILNSSYVSEYDEIKFKICTYDNKAASFSSVGKVTDSGIVFLDKTVNIALNETEWHSSSPSEDDGMRQEEHLIYRLSKQYSSPTIQLNTNLKIQYYNPLTLYRYAFLNKYFVMDSCDIDYRQASIQIKLTEKK